MKFLQSSVFLGLLLLMVGLFAKPVWADDNSTAAREKRVTELKQKLETINYGAKKPKAVVYVFTDMNCDYCRKLHHEFPKLADLGIEVRVLAMPRQGIDSPGYKEWVSIWCSKDQNDSLDRAMEGEEIAVATCKNPIRNHYNLGRKWGVIGTPSVLFADGTLKAGFFSAEKLAKEAIQRTAAVKEKEEKKAAEATKDNTVSTDSKDSKVSTEKTSAGLDEKAKLNKEAEKSADKNKEKR